MQQINKTISSYFMSVQYLHITSLVQKTYIVLDKQTNVEKSKVGKIRVGTFLMDVLKINIKLLNNHINSVISSVDN